MHAYVKLHKEQIILGDSRLANLDRWTDDTTPLVKFHREVKRVNFSVKTDIISNMTHFEEGSHI